MNDLSTIINELIKEKGGSKQDYLNLINSIAYHESAHTMDPTIKQIGGGPGRGKYQFEEGKHRGGIIAARRTKKYLESKGIKIPQWLSKSLDNDSLDATQLTSEQQDALFLGNMRMHPKADFKKVWDGKEDIPTFWANYHWAGKDRDRPKRLKSFNTSLSKYKDDKSFKVIPPVKEVKNTLPIIEKDALNIEQPIINKNILNKFDGGGLFNYINTNYSDRNINSYNVGGLHETNPLGGIPQGIGDNGKPNTVEEGETSFNLKSGKFIFTNRIKL